MKNENLKFVDESGDKKYFAIVPYLIINGYTAEESGVYAYIKRKCGESKNGIWFETKEAVAKNLGISRPTLQKVLSKLEKDKRIKYVGKKVLKTSPIKTYRITDIWKENILAYQRDVKNDTISFKKKKRDVKKKSFRDVKKKSSKKKHILRRINNIYMSYKEKIKEASRLTDSAKVKIRTRLKTFTEEELLKAIDNFSRDNWWMANNSHRGIAWFFHTDDRIEQLINMTPRGTKGEPKERNYTGGKYGKFIH